MPVVCMIIFCCVSQVKELMKALEDAERSKMELEDEYARVRDELLEELALVKTERDAFREKCEVSHEHGSPVICQFPHLHISAKSMNF